LRPELSQPGRSLQTPRIHRARAEPGAGIEFEYAGSGRRRMGFINTVRGNARWTCAVMLLVACPAMWLLVTAQSAPTARLSLVSTAWPPFTNPRGQPRFALDLVETALGRIHVTSKTAIVSAGQFTPTLVSGLVDGSAAAWKDPERERALVFSNPYLE